LGCCTELTLYPYPVEDAPWRFTGWLGDDASLVGSGGVVEMTDDVALGAGFTPEWALVLEDPGITADPEPCYTGRYLDGGKGTPTATPPEGYPVSGGTGDLSGAANPETWKGEGNERLGHPGGMQDISRWLSAAIPPDSRPSPPL